jgi:hypothetical protein
MADVVGATLKANPDEIVPVMFQLDAGLIRAAP